MATTFTPAQQAALAKLQQFQQQRGFLDYTKTKSSESTPATTSQTQGITSLNTQPWWAGQFGSEADANFVDTNRNQQIEDTEKAAWRSQYDPKSIEYKLRSSTDTYVDPVENKDYTEGLRAYLAKQLTERGITDFGQIEKQVIPGVADKWEGDPDAGQYFVPGTPDVTKYYNKTTGKEINNVLFDDKAGTKYILTDQGVQKEFDPITRLSAQLRPYIDPSSTGGAWGTKAGKSSGPGFGPEGMMKQIAQRVQNWTGVSDINQLGFRNTPVVKQVRYDDVGRPYYEEPTYDDYGYYAGVVSRLLTDDEKNRVKNGEIQLDIVAPEIYNKQTGKKILDGNYIDLGGWGEGPGITYASMTFDANGKPKISTYGEDTNTLSRIQPLMTLASIIPSPIQPFAIAANAANAAYNYGNFAPAILAAAGYSGILDSIAGTAANVAGPAGELASNSGIAGLAQDLGVSADLANKIGKVGAQGGLSGTISAAQGKGFGTGFKSGIVSGLAKEGVNELSAATGLDKGLGSLAGPTKSLVSSALTSAALDRPFDIGEAVKNTALDYGFNQVLQAAGFTPKQTTAMNKFLKFAGPMLATRRKPAGG